MQDNTMNLNEGQQAAADGFFQFLFDKGTELIISGPGGVGKTFLMGHMIDEIMPRYQRTCKMMGIRSEFDDVVMTATTNKAAEVLSIATNRPTQTIHSFMNLKVKDDYKTGKSLLEKTNNWRIHRNMIIFVDEASMIDHALLEKIREGTFQCKIVYVGDHCQLAPIMEPISPIYRYNLPFFELTEPMRNNNQPALMQLCQQLRNTVETGDFYPVRIRPGVIDLLNDAEMEAEIENTFKQDADARILAYTNQRVVMYNNHIRELRQFHDTYILGERLINNSAIQTSKGMISVEEELEIIKLGSAIETIHIDGQVSMDVRYADLQNKFGDVYTDVPLPEDKEHFHQLIKFYGKNKAWNHYFHLKNSYPDLRPRDAATVHKAQGSTYDTVYVDLTNLSTCRNPIEAARLLYVAFTRARNRVVLYGQLADKYGGLIQ